MQGQQAPDFTGLDQDGQIVSLSQFNGKKVALYFYPKDNTPGCTAQACNLRDNFLLLKKKGIVVIGVSADSVKSHKNFKTKQNLPFPLIADEDLKIVQLYGVWQLKKFMGREFEGIVRTTFLINESGIIEYIINKVQTKSHTEQILSIWNL